MSILSFIKNIVSQKPLTCSAVIAAGGLSERCKGEDKLFSMINDKPVIAYSIEAFQNCELINEIVIVSRQDKIDHISKICEKYNLRKVSNIVIGGTTRLDSVMNGINAVSKKTKLIAIHDAARPCIDIDIIVNSVTTAEKHNAAAPAIAVSSTLKAVDNNVITKTVDREGLFEIQTPQVFRAEIIKSALSNAKKKSLNVTDDCMAVEQIGIPIHIVEGSRRNLKITVSEDLSIAEALLR